jgi:hypothetical protein
MRFVSFKKIFGLMRKLNLQFLMSAMLTQVFLVIVSKTIYVALCKFTESFILLG